MAGGDADPDCDKPVCAVKDDMFAMMRRTAKVAAEDAGGDASSSGRGIDGVEGAQGGTHPRDKDCPVDKEELGRGTWALLHTMAAYYPDKPDALRKVQARRFFDALGDLYPCTHCAVAAFPTGAYSARKHCPAAAR